MSTLTNIIYSCFHNKILLTLTMISSPVLSALLILKIPILRLVNFSVVINFTLSVSFNGKDHEMKVRIFCVQVASNHSNTRNSPINANFKVLMVWEIKNQWNKKWHWMRRTFPLLKEIEDKSKIRKLLIFTINPVLKSFWLWLLLLLKESSSISSSEMFSILWLQKEIILFFLLKEMLKGTLQ